jgi:hypothetical protein
MLRRPPRGADAPARRKDHLQRDRDFRRFDGIAAENPFD